MITRARRLRLTVAMIVVAAIGLGVLTGTAAAVTEKRTVSAQVVFQHGARADDPGNCSAAYFVQWADVPGTVSGTAFYTYNGAERSKNFAPPFDDAYTWVIPYAVAPGFHWVNISVGWRDGPGADDCSVLSGRQQAIVAVPARVELTVDVPKSQSRPCKIAKAASKVTRAKVKTLRTKLAATTNKADRAKLQTALTKAIGKHKAAVTRVAKAC
jgi:hypothetical protein